MKFGKYIPIVRGGSGACGQVFAVELEGNSKKEAYILKTLIEREDTPANRITLQNEINMLIELNKGSQCENIPKIFYPKGEHDKNEEKKSDENIINEGNSKEDNKIKERPYFVIDYFSKGELYYYIADGGFLEKHARVIFKKIVEAIKFCHEKGICHLDIKPTNIMLDKDFQPVIIDFGFAAKFRDKNNNKIFFTGHRGTLEYERPDMEAREKFDGEKCDLFSLGAVLFNLVTGKSGFIISYPPDKFYWKIMKNKSKEYWESVFKAGVREDLTENFKDLYLKMVAFNPDERATMKDILESPWMQEYNHLSQEKKDNLENEVNEELSIRYNKFQECNSELKPSIEILDGYKTRAFNNENIIFPNNLRPKKIPNDRINMNHYIIINGYINVIEFMNSLYNIIDNDEMFNEQKEFFVEASEKDLRFDVTFENKIEKSIYDDDDENNGKKVQQYPNTKMAIELFQYEDGRYLLEFLRTGGEIKDYYKYFLKIKEIIKEIL